MYYCQAGGFLKGPVHFLKQLSKCLILDLEKRYKILWWLSAYISPLLEALADPEFSILCAYLPSARILGTGLVTGLWSL